MHIRIPGEPVFQKTLDRHVLDPVDRHLHIFRCEVVLQIHTQPRPCILDLRYKLLHILKLIVLGISDRNLSMCIGIHQQFTRDCI